MILRHVRSIPSILLFACACGGDPPAGTGGPIDSEGGTSSGIIPTTPTTSGSGSGSSGDFGADSGTSEGASSGGPPCASDDDCEPMHLCVANACVYDFNWCGEAQVASIIPPQVVLVLDKSGSMVKNSWDHDADPGTPTVTRWTSLFGVVELIVGGFDAQMELGAVLFPSMDATGSLSQACRMSEAPEVPVGPMHGAQILAALPPADADATVVQGGTPATAGVGLAVEHLVTLPEGPQRYLVLVTDGAANCKADAVDAHDVGDVYDEALAPSVAAAYADHGIVTFVVGVDIQDQTSPVQADGQPDATNPYERLNEVAIAGGMPRAGAEKFYNALNQIELSAALTSIAQQVSCTITLDPAPSEDQEVTVEIEGEPAEVARVEGCDGGVGWRFVDPLVRDAIELCPATCAAYQAVAAQEQGLEISYHCATPG